jgi:repressor of nif and glnA expression
MTGEINVLQTNIMLFIKGWAHCQNTPISRKEIMTAFGKRGVKEFTIKWSLNKLIEKGFIRHAVYENARKTFYVMIRNI